LALFVDLITAAIVSSNTGMLWEVPAGGPPRGGPILVEATVGMDIFVPMGNRGLGGWSGSGSPLDGFPLCVSAGVTFRPAGFHSETSDETLICFIDNDGVMHLVDLTGAESRGWPVDLGSGPVTGVSALDLDGNGEFELAVGTSDGLLHCFGPDGTELPGWPVSTGARLLWAPSQIPLGGGQGYAMVVALSSTKVAVYSLDGQLLPGWPCNLGFAVDTAPVCADITGDGISDLVFATGDRRVNVFGLRGFPATGWPYYLEKRALEGNASLARVDPSAGGPQIALATSDSLVYLLDSDGSLAGTWRWPVRADGLPTSPIVTTDRSGNEIVLVATSSGAVQAWDFEGRPVAEASFDLGEGILHAPAAGDIDGDGRIEVVVVGMTGRLAAFDLSAPDPGPWPQVQADSRNSGSYGLSFLPIVEIGIVSGEYSGDVFIPYSMSGATTTGLSVAYSTDAGYSWSRTSNYSAGGGSITWHAAEDMGYLDSQNCLVRITPFGASGPGIAGVTNAFHVDNNAPPVLYLGDPLQLPGGPYRMRYAVQDREGDLVQVQAQFSVDGGSSWQTARLSGTTLEIDPWLYGEPFAWDPGTALDGVDSTLVWFRARAADEDPGPWSVLRGLRVDDSQAPLAQVIVPSSEASGDVRLGMRMISAAGREEEVRCEFSIDNGATWRPASVVPKTEGLTGAYDVEMIWQSRSDAPGVDCSTAMVRAIGTENLPGMAVPSAPFHLDNNYAPEVEILSPTGHGVFDGLVPISFSVSDPEGDEVVLDLQYRLDRGSEWVLAKGLLGGGPFGPSQYRSVLRWNSSADLIGLGQAEAEFRLLASDRDTTISESEGPVALRNSSLPSVVQALVYSVDEGGRQLTVRFELSDPRDRTLDLSISWSHDDGRTWKTASVSGSTAGLRSPGYAGEIVWRYGMDMDGMEGQTLLRLTPVSGDVAGPPRILETVIGI
jgi:hypothetical protein